MNLWHDVDKQRIKADEFLVVVEIKKGSKNKYELDKTTGALILDRILYTSTHYPANYGFIPRTYAEDNDPLDVLVICSEGIDPLSLVRCYPIGAIRMKDNNETDDKIIAIPFGDPSLQHIKEISQISPHILDELMHFFKVYKQLENKVTADITIVCLKETLQIISRAIQKYEEKTKGLF